MALISYILCNNQSEIPLPIEYLGQSIQAIISVFDSDNRKAKDYLLKHTKYIFTLDYRGLMILIPLYLDQIEACIKNNLEVIQLMEKNNKKNDEKINIDGDWKHSSQAVSASINILGSLISIPDYYETYEIPIIKTPGSICTMDYIKEKIQSIIIEIMNKYKSKDFKLFDNNNENTEILVKVNEKAIYCSIVIIYQEIIKTYPNKEKIRVSFSVNY